MHLDGLKRADLMEICAELCRFIMFTGLFYWLLLNAPGFANKITESLRQVGGDAVRGGKAIYPGDLITLGMGVFLNTLKQINYLLPQLSVVPATVALVILIVCCLIAVNMILLLCASWVVIYAGIIFLGFGGCRWTSDLAVNYYRTVLGIGVSLMTMELIIGLGVQLLQQLAASIGDHPDVGQLALVMCATIILAVLAHRLPHMVAGIATGGGYGGAVGGIGVMSLIGAGVAGMSLARSMGGGAAAAVAAEAGVQAHKQLMERIASAEAAVAAGSGGANTGSVVADSGSRPQTDQGLHWPGSRVTRGAGAGGPEGVGETVATRTTATEGKQGKQAEAGGVTPAVAGSEPPQTRPMTANEARGYPPEKPGEPIDWEDERRRIVRGDGNFWKPEA